MIPDACADAALAALEAVGLAGERRPFGVAVRRPQGDVAVCLGDLPRAGLGRDFLFRHRVFLFSGLAAGHGKHLARCPFLGAGATSVPISELLRQMVLSHGLSGRTELPTGCNVPCVFLAFFEAAISCFRHEVFGTWYVLVGKRIAAGQGSLQELRALGELLRKSLPILQACDVACPLGLNKTQRISEILSLGENIRESVSKGASARQGVAQTYARMRDICAKEGQEYAA